MTETMPETPTDRVNRLVAAYVLRDFREDCCPDPCEDSRHRHHKPGEVHLWNCPTVRVEHHQADSTCCSCSEITRLTARIVCDHGHEAEHTYGTIGSIPSVLAELAAEEEAKQWDEEPYDDSDDED